MYQFDYQTPDSLEAALAALRGNDEAKILAGGMTLLPTMKLRLARPDVLIDINRIGSLAGITEKNRAIVIGAMTRHADVAASELVRDRIPALADLAEAIGDPQVRNRGTMGGSVANNDPTADYPAGLVGLGATVVTDRREIAADDFFTDMFETALEERRDHHRRALPDSRTRRLHEVSQSRLALRHCRRHGGAGPRRNPCRGHRGRALRVPGGGNGGCSQEGFHAGRHRVDRAGRRRIQRGHSRQRRVIAPIS